MQLRQQLAAETKLRQDREGELAKGKAIAAETQTVLQKTRADLETATAKYKEATDRAAVSASELAEVKRELSEFQSVSEAALRSQSEKASVQIRKLRDDFDGAVAENKFLSRKLQRLTSVIDRDGLGPRTEWKAPNAPVNFTGKVTVLDPKWQFVVLNAGENQGILPYAELLVTRGGEVVAKLRIKSVEDNQCIANILPGWGSGKVAEGDTVIPVPPGL
ncbi:MAG: hypothetical protein EXS35_17195 [Pedosphaera sp.]|nr:hypothetical protein [Pedosphaera sp.]